MISLSLIGLHYHSSMRIILRVTCLLNNLTLSVPGSTTWSYDVACSWACGHLWRNYHNLPSVVINWIAYAYFIMILYLGVEFPTCCTLAFQMSKFWVRFIKAPQLNFQCHWCRQNLFGPFWLFQFSSSSILSTDFQGFEPRSRFARVFFPYPDSGGEPRIFFLSQLTLYDSATALPKASSKCLLS